MSFYGNVNQVAIMKVIKKYVSLTEKKHPLRPNTGQ